MKQLQILRNRNYILTQEIKKLKIENIKLKELKNMETKQDCPPNCPLMDMTMHKKRTEPITDFCRNCLKKIIKNGLFNK